jgi:hypothetical protein
LGNLGVFFFFLIVRTDHAAFVLKPDARGLPELTKADEKWRPAILPDFGFVAEAFERESFFFFLNLGFSWAFRLRPSSIISAAVHY